MRVLEMIEPYHGAYGFDPALVMAILRIS